MGYSHAYTSKKKKEKKKPKIQYGFRVFTYRAIQKNKMSQPVSRSEVG